ncbi:hypothetical protein KP005_07365 [Geomonas nitrogeniifigens]|uniref:Glycosyltransferase RgtA/B/C/D-like domain-containing protein n=1 Tax=Geomonas diazotrophica TaxID=2843197 RepID=A0ABX8JUJ9_9BACT|nr:hypothetical protein [Geomonas nitrogeniifigens]QWV99090.1 hypothetical protein KP005_07365 [Geomonas nitrogeniifigens]
MSNCDNKKSFLLPSIGDFLFIALFLLIALYSGKKLLNDGDTGYHIRAGEYMLRTHTIPHQDMFSFLSPPLPWTAHEWLSEVIMALIHQASGLTGVVIFFAFFLALSCFLLFKMIRAEGDILVCLFVVLLVGGAAQLHWLARPHVFSLVIMVAWYYILDQYQYQGKNHLFLLPLIMIPWANLHGGFMGGFILLGAYFLGNALDAFFGRGEKRDESLRRLRPLGLAIVACIAASAVNPHGFHLLLFPFQLTSSKVLMDGVSEFLSPNFHEYYIKYFELLLFVLLATVGLSRYKLNPVEIILVLLFTHMSLFSARYIPLFGIIVAPIVSKRLTLVLNDSESGFARFLKQRSTNIASIDSCTWGYLWPLVTVAAVVILAGSGRIHFQFDPKIKPMAAIEFLKREQIPGNMFNNDEFGDCLIYGAAPAYKVFIDGRLDMYGADRLKEYFKVITFKQGWETILEKYRMSWIIFPADTVLSRHLLIDPNWKLIYADKVTNIFVRNVPEYRYLMEKYPNVRPAVQDDKEDRA